MERARQSKMWKASRMELWEVEEEVELRQQLLPALKNISGGDMKANIMYKAVSSLGPLCGPEATFPLKSGHDSTVLFNRKWQYFDYIWKMYLAQSSSIVYPKKKDRHILSNVQHSTCFWGLNDIDSIFSTEHKTTQWLLAFVDGGGRGGGYGWVDG